MLLVEKPVIKNEKVKIKPCLIPLPDEHLDSRLVSLGNLTIHSKDGKIINNLPLNCCQGIHVDWLKPTAENNTITAWLEYAYYQGEKYYYKDCFARMTIVLSDFINPFKSIYSNDLEYITEYLSLLQEMGSPWYIEIVNEKEIVLRMNYSEFDPYERAWLVFHWQAVRNLILNYTLHVPARFINLVKLYRKDFDLLFLYQAAYRMIPLICLSTIKGTYSIENYSSFVKVNKFSLNKIANEIFFNKIIRTLNVNNLRSRLYKEEFCKKFFFKNEIKLNFKEYESLYKDLVTPQDVYTLYIKLRLLKSNKLHEK
jgi:hypothetical protein